MALDKKVLSYWQHCAYVYALLQTNVQSIQHNWRAISPQEAAAGKIVDQSSIESLLLRGTTMVVAPQVAMQNTSLDQQFFIPYYLLVELSQTGKFITKQMLALPLVPKNVLEPAALRPIILGSAEQFDNYLAINPPIWQEEPSLLTWQAQTAYAEQLLADVTEGHWWDDLQQLGFTRLPHAIVFPLADLAVDKEFSTSILERSASVELISAERSSGKSDYARSLLHDAWVEAAVKQAPPPEYVWLQFGLPARYASIIDERQALPNEDLNVLHNHIRQKFNLYHKGRQLLKNWQDVSHNLQQIYAEYGGIKLRHKQLEEQYAAAKAQTRLMQVLTSIWERQSELVPRWSKPLDFMPALQRRRLHRLYKFFQHNFPDQDVQNHNQAQMTVILNEKMNCAMRSEHLRSDALHQVANDIQQETMLRTKIEQWEWQHNYDIADNKLWDEVVTLTKQYWKKFLTKNVEYADFFDKAPGKIDTLIVEHAEYVPPMTAAALLAKSSRAVIMGNYDSLANPNFSTHLDYEIAKAFDLVNCDADFEDLQFDGVLGSTGNLWSLAAAGREADQIFPTRQLLKLDYTIINVEGISQPYLGSRVNFAEIDATLQWLKDNSKTAWQIAIYTNFSGQRDCLRDALREAGFGHVAVNLLQVPCFQQYDVVLFSPVYCVRDKGPYNFDRGDALLNNMQANTRRRLILVGDAQIFKPQLHSAAGKFAKLFIKEEVVSV